MHDKDGWRKGSTSTGNSNCVELKADDAVVLVRDSKNKNQPPLSFSRKAMTELFGRIRSGDLS